MTPLDLITAIRAHDLTQVQIAERSGVTQSTVSKIERGEVKDVLSASYLALQALYQELENAKPAKKRKAARVG